MARAELLVPAADVADLRALAVRLRANQSETDEARQALRRLVREGSHVSAFEALGSDLADAEFEGIFEQSREAGWRASDL